MKMSKKRCISRLKIHTICTIGKKIRTISTILGLKKSVHFGHHVLYSDKYFPKSEPELKEFEPRLKYRWFQLYCIQCFKI